MGEALAVMKQLSCLILKIEPEKDIVLILSSAAKTENIVNAIRKNLNIDEPGAGIIFVLDVNRAVGLSEK